MLTAIQVSPGIIKQTSPYGAKGGWVDSDNVRFRYSLPEKIGGWASVSAASGGSTLLGVYRDMRGWNTLTGTKYVALGGNWKLMLYDQYNFYDITPTRATFSGASASGVFSTTSGSQYYTVSIPGHGAQIYDFVSFAGNTIPVGGVSTGVWNSQFQIQSVSDTNNFLILGPTPAGSSTTSGGATTATFQVHITNAQSLQTGGWGVQTWDGGTWDTPRTVSFSGLVAGAWCLDNYGQNLIATNIAGSTYQWDPVNNGTGVSAQVVSGAPTTALFNLVSNERVLFLFGTEVTIGTPTSLDLLFYRWSSIENINDWNPTAVNTAGFLRAPDGTQLMSAIKSRGQILLFTDNALYGIQYVGPPYTYGQQQLGTNCGAVSLRSTVDVNGQAFWMSKGAFYTFTGTVQKIPCTVLDWVFKNTGGNPGINTAQYSQVYAALNSLYNEITWFYPSANSSYNDSWVTYNYLENVWTIGKTWSRTSWIDRQILGSPYGAGYNQNSSVSTSGTITPFVYGLQNGRTLLYQHEYGTDSNGTAMTAYITSADMDLPVAGEQVAKMSRFIPDYQNFSGTIYMNVQVRNYSQVTLLPSSNSPFTIIPTTQKIDTRARGRQIAFTMTSSNLGDQWRFATIRADLQPDGMR